MSRKEIKKKAKHYLKEHYWLLVAACLLAAWVGSDFSNALSPMKLYSTSNMTTSNAATYSTSMLGEGQTANASDAIYEAIHGNAEEGKYRLHAPLLHLVYLVTLLQLFLFRMALGSQSSLNFGWYLCQPWCSARTVASNLWVRRCIDFTRVE